MEHQGWTFLCGCAPRIDFVFFARERDDVADRGATVTSFYSLDEQRPDPALHWGIYSELTKWRAITMASVKPAGAGRLTVALGSSGQYYEVEPATANQYVGTIDNFDGIVRRLCSIEDAFFAVGMGRSVIMRKDRGRWEEFGPGTKPIDRDRIVGFEGIDGLSDDHLYVAGWHGEVWRWNGGAWHAIDSPTTANLNAVACRSDGYVYAVGDNGSMIGGIDDRWEVIETKRPENLQDIAIFGDEVFVVTDYKILRLEPDGLTAEDRFVDGDAPSTCLHLLVAEDGLVSMGPKDLFAFNSGIWRRVV